MSNILDYPVEQRPRLAVAKFRRIQGEWLFDQLLEYLDLTYDKFVTEYGEKLVSDPTCLSNITVDMIVGNIRRGRTERKTRGIV